MKKVYFICYDEQCQQSNEALPIITIFTVNDQTESKDIETAFGKHISDTASRPEDCPMMRYAADKVCEEFMANVEFVEADQEFGIPRNEMLCLQCDTITCDDGDEYSPYEINAGFTDRHTVCFACHRNMMDNGDHTMCDCCGAYFTYNHLLPNKDDPEGSNEICPYCGEIWCE